jgi:hypothetical protein
MPYMRYKGETMEYNEMTKQIIGSAIGVHQILGPGLLENVYKDGIF